MKQQSLRVYMYLSIAAAVVMSKPMYSRADLEVAAQKKHTPENNIPERRRTNARIR